MKKNTGKLRLEKITLKTLNAAALVDIAGGSFDGPSVWGGNSGCGCGNSWQNTCPKTQ
jgi:hypothetical protein